MFYDRLSFLLFFIVISRYTLYISFLFYWRSCVLLVLFTTCSFLFSSWPILPFFFSLSILIFLPGRVRPTCEMRVWPPTLYDVHAVQSSATAAHLDECAQVSCKQSAHVYTAVQITSVE